MTVDFGQRASFESSVTRPVLDFVLPGLLARTVGIVAGRGGVGKSMLALQIALGVALGRPIAGGLWAGGVGRPGPVRILFGEDDIDILRERLFWLRRGEGLTDADCARADKVLDVRSTVGLDMRVTVRKGGDLGAFFSTLREAARGQRLVILDPLAFLHDSDENDNGTATTLMRCIQYVAQESGAAIILLHHFGKPSKNGSAEEWTAMRGASALHAAARWQVHLRTPSEADIKEAGFQAHQIKDRSLWLRVSMEKSNYGPIMAPQWLYRAPGEGGVLRLRRPPAEEREIQSRAATYRALSNGDDDDDF